LTSNSVLVSPTPSAELSRRAFLRNSLSAAVPLALVVAGVPMTASASVYTPPTRQRGSTVRNVKNYGAVGNGIHDDTAAFQSAIKSLPSAGGTIYVPAGTYLIDALKSVKMRSYMHLKLDPSAKLVAKPTSSGEYTIVFAENVHDIEISGGQLIGERDHHKGTGGEGGHCIRVRGCARVTIRDIRLAKGWGDGLVVGPKPRFGQRYIYSTDVAVANIVCSGNRRNGLSITNVLGMKVYDSEFSDTHGTKPQCGMDIEPSKDIDGSGHCDQVHIENCIFRGNAAYGINVWKNVSNLAITKCLIEKNKSCGLVTRGLTTASFTGNTICNNYKTGLFIQIDSRNVASSGNVFYNNYLANGATNRTAFYLTGVSTKVQKDVIRGDGTYNINIGKNYYK
jgi:polygalacturonase